MTLIGIIPAAGRSGRMGAPKQLLHVDGRPMIVGIVEALVGGDVARVIVVTSTALREKLPHLSSAVGFAMNDDPRTNMIDSVRIGLTASPRADGYVVCPSDAAGLTAVDVRRCVDAFAETPDRIVIAAHGDRRGHPMIFPASLADAVSSSECDGGLNLLARNRPQLVREVACASPGTVANVNTPADYQQLP